MISRPLIPLFVTALILFSGASALKATPYYVAPSGSNLTGSGTLGNPWQTIAYALDYVQPGDILYMRAGIYNEQVVTVRSGTENAYITIAAYGDEVAIIDGTGGFFNNGVIIDHSYLKLQGFTVRSWQHTGVWMRDCHFVELHNLKITAVTGGIALTGTVHDFVVDSCTIYDYYGGAGGSGFDATPYGTDSIYNGSIRNSKAYLTAGAFDNCDGFGLGHDGVSKIHLYNCEVYGVGDGFDISGAGIVLERCSAHDCTYGGGYKLWRDSVTLVNCLGYNNSTNVELDFDASTQKGVSVRMVNCTLYGPRNANIAIENSAGGSTLQLYNCILAGGNNIGLSFDGDTISGYTGDYNVFHVENQARMIATSTTDFSLSQIHNGGWTAASGQDAHTLVVFDADSLFLDTLAINPNLRLKAGAAAIDHGAQMPDAPTTDFDGCPRIVGQIDIGAFEFGACAATGISDQTFREATAYRLNANYPNPFNPATTISFRIPLAGRVTIAVFDVLGRHVATVMEGAQEAGEHSVRFDASALSSGVYVCRMSADQFVSAVKMMVVK